MTLFDDLTAPLGRQRFFAEHWDRLAFHGRGAPDRFAALFDRDALGQAAERCQVLKAGFKDSAGWSLEVPIQPAQVKRLFEAGMTICLGRMEETPPLAAFLAAARRELGHGVHFNCYYSPDGKGFGLHFDNHPVMLLQISGAKRWIYSLDPEVTASPTNVIMPPDRDAIALPWGTIRRPHPARMREVVLEPGDVLYLPAGCWHEAAAIGHSLALTMAVTPLTLLELAQRAASAKLAGHPALLARLGARPERPAPELFAQGLAELRRLTDSLTPDDLYHAWRGQ